MLMPESVDILQLVCPPEGYAFHAGLWLSHDVSWKAVCDLLAPALAGVIVSGDRRVQETRGAVSDKVPGLLILHAGGDRFSGGPVLPWVKERAITGRRQHAKAALLQYRSPSGAKTLTKVLVGSANLTRSGLTSNLEVMAWDERGSGQEPFLGVDLLREMRKLKKELPDLTILRKVLTTLAGGLRDMRPTGALMSSLGTEKPLIPGPKASAPHAQKVVVVSPGFAGDTDTKAAQALAPWCGPETNVDIYTGFAGSRKQAESGGPGLILSAGLLRGLRKTGATVTIHAVPEIHANGDDRRRLHAKVVAIMMPTGTTRVFTGSANCTGPGLNGINREMMVVRHQQPHRIEQMVAALDAVPYTGRPEKPPTKVQSVQVLSTSVVSAVFNIDAGAHADSVTWPGILTVTLVTGPASTTVEFEGDEIPLGVPVPMDLDPDRGTVTVSAGGKSHVVQIDVVAPAEDEEFWTSLTPERRIDRPDRDLERLLRDVARVGTAKPPSSSKVVDKKPMDDGFSIPLSQRLVVIARHRRALREYSASGMRRLADEYLDARSPVEVKAGVRKDELDAARGTVLAIHAAYDRKTLSPENPILVSLRDAVTLFDKLSDDGARD